MWSKIPPILKNKYFLVFIALLVWLVFFDTHNFIQQYRMHQQLRNLHKEREYFLEEIKRDSLAIEELKNDPDALERYAREQYHMKREGEDVYVIVED